MKVKSRIFELLSTEILAKFDEIDNVYFSCNFWSIFTECSLYNDYLMSLLKVIRFNFWLFSLAELQVYLHKNGKMHLSFIRIFSGKGHSKCVFYNAE